MVEFVRTPYGILAPASAAGSEGAVRRALKQLDPDLILTVDRDDEYGCMVWRVFRAMGDQDAQWVCDWRRNEHEEPLPLSHALVDKVSGLRLGSRAPRVDPEESNQRHVDRMRTDRRHELGEYLRDGHRAVNKKPAYVGFGDASHGRPRWSRRRP